MYYIVYALFYAISLLPFFILYGLSDFAYFIVYYIVGYRKKVVMDNLAIAFPEMAIEQRKKIAKQFYKNFVDTLIETIKLLSLSDKQFAKRCTGNFDEINALADTGRNIQFMCCHQFNWEYINLVISRNVKIPLIGIMANIENSVINRIFIKIRARYGTVLIPNAGFKRKMVEWMKKQHAIALAADQNSSPDTGLWLDFFGKPVPFIMGPHISAVRSKPIVIYFIFKKGKRGYYNFEVVETLPDPENFTPEELAIKYRNFLEAVIRKDPENYLWSHRRWKHTYKASYKKSVLGSAGF